MRGMSLIGILLLLSTIPPLWAQGSCDCKALLLQKIEQSLAEANNIEDYTCIFTKRELIGTKEVYGRIFLKFKRRPRWIYMKWLDDGHKGQELIWSPHWNKGRIYVHGGGWKKLIKLHLEPDGSLALREARHPIYCTGFENLLNKVVEQLQILRDVGVEPEVVCNDNCFLVSLNKDACPRLYGYRVEICFSQNPNLPCKVKVWDKVGGILQVVEEYQYSQIRINVGLTPDDFDPQNPLYDF